MVSAVYSSSAVLRHSLFATSLKFIFSVNHAIFISTSRTFYFLVTLSADVISDVCVKKVDWTDDEFPASCLFVNCIGARWWVFRNRNWWLFIVIHSHLKLISHKTSRSGLKPTFRFDCELSHLQLDVLLLSLCLFICWFVLVYECLQRACFLNFLLLICNVCTVDWNTF